MDQWGARTVTEDVAERLRRLIHQGEISPGDRLPPERELAETLGVARVSLREAIKILQGHGYLVVRRGAHGGTFVTDLDGPYRQWIGQMRQESSELEDILDFRIAIESQTASLAATRRGESDLADQRVAIERMAAAEGRSEFRLADSQFHGAVARASRSKRLEAAVHYARGELFSHPDQLVYVEQIETCVGDHRLIHEAIADRDPAAAAAAMREHIERTRAELRELLFGDER
ncbi:DNA-binding FadR family transcriptional regulator [Thermocatellispora tengchongensis]|uniref:DNA-binding FadR family transcriptional regulator n=1 Tax=Thermocatellispora tengchongensis TaxID=1073253 RepID=A0A840NYD4_9ACTN|nr:FCD domain-containing protein [Thermocatellispora tengchongensis]MBB5132192.1 DNA-binding FadR family transcriptional regulator [Thermocatellispora tengchongensis]